jgi:gliding motility-associated-like protein
MYKYCILIFIPFIIWGFSSTNETSFKHVVQQTTTSGDTLKLDDMIFADFFSPNNDGFNDTYVILNVENWPGNSLKVFNRWGEVVFIEAPYLNDWDGNANQDGTFKEKKLPDGVYFFEFYNGKGYKVSGKITLKR